MSVFRVALVLGVALPALVLAQDRDLLTPPEAIAQPEPTFPPVEIIRGHEGWVLANCIVTEDGVIGEVTIEDSSGSEAFEEAALDAIRKWQYEHTPGDPELTVLVNFEFHRARKQLDRQFFRSYRSANGYIESGKLNKAQDLVDKMRRDRELTALELAYINIVDGRIAGQRGDRSAQLSFFRKAMLNDGRWVEDKTYRRLLYASVVLAVQQEDFASAIRDYDILTSTEAGRRMAADLDDPIRAIRAMVKGDHSIAPPFMVADIQVTVKEERSSYSDPAWRDPRTGADEQSYQRMRESGNQDEEP